MQYVLPLKSALPPDIRMNSYGSAATNYPAPQAQECDANSQFVDMLISYRSSGGLARAQEVLALIKRHYGSDIATLAPWTIKGKVISFEWQSELWLPLFQFNRIDMTPQPGLGTVLAELTSIYDAWELANWFARANAWLADQTPAETLALDPTAVLQAARADRFIVAG